MARKDRRPSALGGDKWSPRMGSLRAEIGRIWGRCGVSDEWSPLRSVLLHRPGRELEGIDDPAMVQMLEAPDPRRAGRQHDSLAAAYREAGVEVHCVSPGETPPPNLMFVADLMFMTPEGAILGRPASTVRAGEERLVARRLAELGVPILRSVGGKGTFEGADAMWLDPGTVLIAVGLRTNSEGAAMVAAVLKEMGVEVLCTTLGAASMHLMGQLRFPAKDLAVAWRRRMSKRTAGILKEKGTQVLFIPDEQEAAHGMALNLVTLRPMEILMPAGNPATQAFLECRGIACRTAEIGEIAKAAGGIGCLTGILERAKEGKGPTR